MFLRRKFWSPGGLASLLGIPVFLALTFLAFPQGALAQLPVIRFVRDPDAAPDFQVRDLDGRNLSIKQLQGKVVLLNFWATWCGPCREEIPSLVELQKHYPDRMKIVGMVVDEDDVDALRAVIAREGINYPVALTTPETRHAYGGIAALPTLFVINPEGRVVQKHVGLFNPALYETEVRALLNLPIAARVETFEDTGAVFLAHADRATSLPGVNLMGLTDEQRAAVLHKLNAEICPCGCKYTLAQCRIYDPPCRYSRDRAAEIVKEVSTPADKEKAPEPAAPGGPPPPVSTKPASP